MSGEAVAYLRIERDGLFEEREGSREIVGVAFAVGGKQQLQQRQNVACLIAKGEPQRQRRAGRRRTTQAEGDRARAPDRRATPSGTGPIARRARGGLETREVDDA